MASSWPATGDTASGVNPRNYTKPGPSAFRAHYRNTVGNSDAVVQVPLVIRGVPSQTADMFGVYDTNRNLLAFIDCNGLISAGGSAGNKVVHGVYEQDLTAAQIISMFTTPIAVVPAPPAGNAIVVQQIVVVLNLTATAFASGGVVHFFYHGQTTEIMAQTLAAATVNGATGQYIFVLEPVQTSGGSVVTKEVGIDITNLTGVFATGTGTAKIFTTYQIVTL